MLGRWERGQGKPQFDYLVKLADVLEVSLDRLLLGQSDGETDAFDIRNRKLKELCRQVDQLQSEDQDIICRFLDMAVRHNRFKELVDGPLRAAG